MADAAERPVTAAPFDVVVVDDNPDDRVEVRRLLLLGDDRRYRFTDAETGVQAIAACLERPGGPPDCVILDYYLPDMDAVEVLTALRAGRAMTVCPVVVLTGSVRAGHGPAMLQAGAQDYVGKGWMNAESLTRTVENAVERYAMARAIQEREEALRESEERLRDANLRKDEFLAILAHELRNPLAPLRMGLSLLGQDAPGRDPARIRAMMERQLGSLIRLVDDLLDASRIGSGKVKLVRERVELHTIVAAALEASRPALDAAGHRLTVLLPGEPLWIDGDRTRLAQVLCNLLNNAAKYTPRGGHVELEAEARGGEVVLRVRDDGCGIAKEMLSRVFEMFTQVDRTLSRAQGGLGIGLSLVRGLVELHGGKVTAESAGLGHGSTFTIKLPRAAAPLEDTLPPEDAGPPSQGQQGQSRRILVIDDNVDAADCLAEILRLSGHEAQVAHDGAEGLLRARGLAPEVVFLDIGLPGMDGYEVARRLRAEPRLASAVLVALTGWGSEEDRRRAHQAGFDHHLTKPADPEAVTELLAGLDQSLNGPSIS